MAVCHVFAWLWLRKMVAEMRRITSADDAYRRFEENTSELGGDAAMFEADDDGDAVEEPPLTVADAAAETVAVDIATATAAEAGADGSLDAGVAGSAAVAHGTPPARRPKPPPPSFAVTPPDALTGSASSKKSKKGRKKSSKKPDYNEFTGV